MNKIRYTLLLIFIICAFNVVFGTEGDSITHWDTAGDDVTSPYGITTDGNYIWISDTSEDEVYKYTMAGVYTEVHWDTAGDGVNYPRGIATNGDYIWISDPDDDEVYKFEGDAPVIVPSINSSFSLNSNGDWKFAGGTLKILQ